MYYVYVHVHVHACVYVYVYTCASVCGGYMCMRSSFACGTTTRWRICWLGSCRWFGRCCSIGLRWWGLLRLHHICQCRNMKRAFLIHVEPENDVRQALCEKVAVMFVECHAQVRDSMQQTYRCQIAIARRQIYDSPHRPCTLLKAANLVQQLFKKLLV